jgi:biopolymer transport protein ExbB
MMKNMQAIPAFIALLPLMGLLGTVTGMIQVFDVMANLGSGNPRAMANGVSAATLPTMSGMLVAIIAIPFWTLLDRRYKSEVNKLRELIVEE